MFDEDEDEDVINWDGSSISSADSRVGKKIFYGFFNPNNLNMFVRITACASYLYLLPGLHFGKLTISKTGWTAKLEVIFALKKPIDKYGPSWYGLW